MQLYIFRFLLIGLYLLSSCTRFSNKADPVVVQCGPSADSLFKPVLDAEGRFVPASDLEAFILQSDKRTELSISEKGCVGLPLESATGSIVIRTHSGKPQGVLLSAQEVWNMDSIALRAVGDDDIFLNCPDVTYTDGTFLNLNPLLRGTFDPNTVRVRLRDEASQNLQAAAFLQDGQWLVKLPTLAHGTHALAFQAENLLNAFKKPVSATCNINVDLTTPSASIPYQADYDLDPGHSVWRRNPGQPIQIASEGDGFPQEILYCLKEMSNVDEKNLCSSADFLPWSDSLSAPEQGLWHLEYFVRDAAGHRSTTTASSFLVYRESEIKAIRALLESAENDLSKNEQIKAGRKILDADQQRRRMTSWEAADLEYAVLQASLKLMPVMKQKAILREANPLSESISPLVAFSEDGEKLVTAGQTFEILDRKGKHLGELKGTPVNAKTIDAIGFADNDSTIWVRYDNSNVSFFDTDGTLRCSKQNLGPIDVFPVSGDTYVGIGGWTPNFVTMQYDVTAQIFNSHCTLIDSFEIKQDEQVWRPEFSFFFSANTNRFGIHQISESFKSKIFIRDLHVADPVRIVDGALQQYTKRASVVASFTQDAKTFAVCDMNGNIRALSLIGLPDAISQVGDPTEFVQTCFFNKNDHLMISNSKSIALYRKNSQGQYMYYESEPREKMYPVALTFDPSKSYIMEYGSVGENQARAIIRSTEDPHYDVKTLNFHADADSDSISKWNSIALNPKTSEAAISKINRELSLWNLKDDGISRMRFSKYLRDTNTYESPDGSFIVQQETFNRLALWSKGSKTPTVLTTPDLAASIGGSEFSAFTISPDSRYIATSVSYGANTQGIQIWDRNGEALPFIRLTQVSGDDSLVFSPDSQYLAFSSGYGSIAFARVGESTAKQANFLPTWTSTVITTNRNGFYLASIKKDEQGQRSDCQINSIDAEMQASLFSDICYGPEDITKRGGNIDRAVQQTIFGQALTGEFVSLNLVTRQRQTLLSLNEPSGLVQQRNGIFMTKSLTQNRLTVMQEGAAPQSINLGFPFPQPLLFLDKQNQIWAGSDRGVLEYRRLNGELLMSLPYKTLSATTVDNGSTLIVVISISEVFRERWVLPLGIDQVIEKLRTWGF